MARGHLASVILSEPLECQRHVSCGFKAKAPPQNDTPQEVMALNSLRNLSANPCSDELRQRMLREGCLDSAVVPMTAFPKETK
eukprot:5551528-Amphidinium_carterae.1